MNNNNGTMDFEARLRLNQLDKDLQALHQSFKQSAEKSKAEYEKLQQAIKKAKTTYSEATQKIKTESNIVSTEIGKLKTQMLGFLTIGGATLLAKEIFNVRNEFQKLESSFTTMLQSKQKADQLMNELTTLAATTPFGLQDVAEGAKRLLAFQVPAQEVTQTLKRMGDVASGLGVPMGRLINVYGQIKAQGKMLSNDLMQFTSAGIPIIAELSKVLKISEQDVKELVSQGKIGFAEIQQVFQNMTNQGGLFYNMMEGQSKTLGGQLSNLQDNLSQMFNELGKSSEGIFSGAIQGANFLVENYQKVGKVIAELVAVYGTYRTALMINLVLTQGLSAAAKKDALAKGIQTIATKAQTLAQAKLNATMLANPYVLVAAAVAGLAYGIYKLVTHQTASEKAQEKLNESVAQFEKQTISETQNLNSLVAQLKATEKGTETYNKIKSEIINKYGEYLEGLSEEKKSLEDLEGAYDAIIKKMREKHRFQGFLQGIENINKELAEKVGDAQKDIKETLIKGLGDKQGKEVYFKLLPVLEADEVDFDKLKKILDLSEDGNVIKGGIGDKLKDKGFFGNYLTDIYQSIVDINHEKNAANKVIKEAQQEMMAISSPKKEEKNKTTELDSIKHTRNKLLKDLQETNVKINALQSRSGQTVKTDAEIKELQEKKKQLEEQLKVSYGWEKEKTSKKEKSFDPEAFARETQRKAFDNEILTQKNQIEQMAEGFAKEKALIELHYKEKAEAIRRGSEDALLALDKEKKESKGKMSAETYELRKSVIIENQTISNNANEQQKNQQEQKLFENLLNQYKDYETQRTEILEKYAQERAILQEKLNTDISEKEKKQLENALSEAEKQKNKAISEIDLKQSDKHILAEMYGDLSDKTVTEIERINERVQEFLQTLQGEYSVEISAKFGISEDTFKTLKNDPEKLKEIAQKGKEINRITIENKGIFHSLKHNIKEALDAKNPEKFKEAMGKIQGNVQQVMGLLGGFASIVKSIGNATQSAGLQELAGGLETVMSAVDSTMQGVQMGASIGGPWGAAIGGALGLLSSGLSKAAEAEQKHAENMKKIKEAEINYQRTLNDLIFKENMLMKDKKSIFGTKEIATAIGHLALYKEQWGKLNESINEAEEGYKHFSEISGKAMERHVREHGKLPKMIRKGLFDFGANIKQTKLENIQIKTGSYTTGYLWWKKTHDVYRSIVDEYPNLINAQGEFNKAVAEGILKERDFRDGQKEQLQDIINQYDRMKEAEAKFDEYLQNTFGHLGTSMMDSVIHSLKTGEDAFESFAKSVGDTIGTLAKQIAYEIFLADEFKAFQERIKKGVQKVQENNSFSAEEKSKKTAEFMRDQTAQFSDSMKGKIEGMKAFIEDFNKGTAQMGYDFLNNETRQASEKGFAKMSQDTADELHGQFRLLTQLSAETKTAMLQVSKEVSDGFKFMQSHSAQQLKHLAGIETNTFTLHDMKKDLSAMKNTLADMETKGIKIR